MARTRKLPIELVMPRVEKTVVLSTWRGAIVVKKWPRKVGRAVTQAVGAQQAFFASARRLAKMVDPTQLDAAIKQTKNTGLYPNDLIMSAMMRGLYLITRNDNKVLQPFDWHLEPVTMQGCDLTRTTTFLVAGGAQTPIPWQVANLNNALMWDITLPSRITVPQGVTVIQLAGGCVSISTSGTPTYNLFIRKNGSLQVSNIITTGTATQAGNCFTGPLVVTAGDYFELLCLRAISHNIQVAQRPYFGAQILQAA